MSPCEQVLSLVNTYNQENPLDKLPEINDAILFHVGCILSYDEILNDPVHSEEEYKNYQNELSQVLAILKTKGVDKIVFHAKNSKDKAVVESQLFKQFLIDRLDETHAKKSPGGRPKKHNTKVLLACLNKHVIPLIEQKVSRNFIATLFDLSLEGFNKAFRPSKTKAIRRSYPLCPSSTSKGLSSLT